MSNRRISELNQLYPYEFTPSDLLISVDVDTGTGLPETKKVLIGEFTDYLVAQTTGSISASVSDLSSSIVNLSSSVSSLVQSTSSYSTVTQLNTKLDNSLTGSYIAYGLPVLSSSGLIYSNFLPNFVSTFNGRQGNVLPIFGDYSSSMISHSSSVYIPHSNVSDALEYLGQNKLNLSGGTLTGPLILDADPTVSLEAATKDYVDQRVLKSGDTMTGPLSLPGIYVGTNLIYVNPGTASVGIGTSSPTQSAALHVIGRVRIDELQFSSDETIQTTAGAGVGGVSSFNLRTGSVVSIVSDYQGFYVDDFLGRSGSVEPQAGDYDGLYISTTGSTLMSSSCEVIFDTIGLISFEESQSVSSDRENLNFQKDLNPDDVAYTKFYQNTDSTQNPIVQTGDFAIILKKSVLGSDIPVYESSSHGFVIAAYSETGSGIRISNHSVETRGTFKSDGESQFTGSVFVSQSIYVSESIVYPDSTIQTTAFIPYFTSSGYTIDTLVTAPHGLSRNPYIVQAKLRCIFADAGFNVGEEVTVLPISSSLYTDNTNIYFLPKVPLVRSKDGLTDATLVDSNWEAVLTAI